MVVEANPWRGHEEPARANGAYLGAKMRRAWLFLAFVAGMVFMTCGVASAATCEINGGAKYTNSTSVHVSYSPGVFDKVFQISNDDIFAWLDDWQPVDIRPYVN